MPEPSHEKRPEVVLGGGQKAASAGVMRRLGCLSEEQESDVSSRLVRGTAVTRIQLEHRIPEATVGQLTFNQVVAGSRRFHQPSLVTGTAPKRQVAIDDPFITPVEAGSL